LFLCTGGAMIAVAGWRASFWLAAIGPVVGLVIATRVLSNSDNIINSHPSGKRLQALKSVLRNKPAMLSIWAYTFHSWELLALWAWLPAYLAAAAANQNSIASAAGIGSALAGLTFLTNAVGSVAGGHMSDAYGRRRVMLLMTGTSIAFSLLFGWLFTMPLWLLTLVAIFYNMAALGDSSVYSSALSELVPAEDLSTAYALRATLGFGLGALSPMALGFALDYASLEAGSRGTVAWGLAWSMLGLGALPGLWAISRMRDALRLTHSSPPL
jgi:MFS family permease